MPQIGANFQFTSRQPNFERDQFDTIANMKKCTVCDEGHKCYCLENQKTYEFASVDSNGDAIQPNQTTGYWHEFSSGGSGDVTGATIGSGASEQNVTKVGNILKFPAYPTVPIKGIKDANGNDINPDSNGKVTLPAASAAPITKIKVDGASDDLPINEGRVVIPSIPVKGIKTNDGTTLTPDENDKVTLPAIPAAPTSDTMQYSDSNSYSNGSIGKALKDIRKPGASLNSNFKYAVSRSGDPTLTECLNAMWDELHPVETTDPIPVSPTVVDLDGYDETDDSFTYDDDTIYIYGVSNTSKVVYNDDGTDYAVFKVNDVDKYIRYEITESGGTVTYTCEDVYTLSNLPSEARSLFEISKYAAVKVITGTKTDYFYKDRYAVFVDSDNRPMQNDFYEATESNTTVKYALFKSNNNGDLYLYKASSLFYKFQSKITSSDANYATYDAHFGASSAGKISFDDTITQLSIPGYPVNNVQTAIQLIATKVYGPSSTLIITLIYSNGNRIANKWFDISSTFQGNSYDFSSQLNDADNAQYVTTVDGVKKFKTNSNGECRIGLPIGATYNITFNSIANFATPNDISGIADSTTCNISASYTALSQSEEVLIKVLMANVSNSITPNNKKVYIDLYDSNNEIDVSKYYEITVNAAGLVSSVKRKNDNSDTYSTISDKSISIDQGRRYKVYLEDWEGYNAETTSIIISQNINRVVVLKYTYLLSGMYILLNDIYNPLGYESCKVLDIDTTNNRVKIIKNVNGTEGNYWIYHKSNNGIYMYGEYQDTSSEIELISEQNINTTFVGIGLRNQELNTASLSENSLSGTCAFFINANVTISTTVPPHPRYVNSSYDGQSNCDSLVGLDTPSYPIYDTVHSNTCTLGNNTYNAYLPSYRQFLQIIGNYSSLSSIFSIFGKSMFAVTTGTWAISTYQETDYIHYFNNASVTKSAYYGAPSSKFLPIFSF